jgi:hypothetical protein
VLNSQHTDRSVGGKNRLAACNKRIRKRWADGYDANSNDGPAPPAVTKFSRRQPLISREQPNSIRRQSQGGKTDRPDSPPNSRTGGQSNTVRREVKRLGLFLSMRRMPVFTTSFGLKVKPQRQRGKSQGQEAGKNL